MFPNQNKKMDYLEYRHNLNHGYKVSKNIFCQILNSLIKSTSGKIVLIEEPTISINQKNQIIHLIIKVKINLKSSFSIEITNLVDSYKKNIQKILGSTNIFIQVIVPENENFTL